MRFTSLEGSGAGSDHQTEKKKQLKLPYLLFVGSKKSYSLVDYQNMKNWGRRLNVFKCSSKNNVLEGLRVKFKLEIR